MVSKKLRAYFLISIALSIVVGLVGYVYTARDLPPYPGRIVSEKGEVLTGKDRIMAGQQVWQKYGLMDLGSVWGHGTYRGPDFTAQALHNLGQVMRQTMAQKKHGADYDKLTRENQGAIDAVVIDSIKRNRYDPAKDTLNRPGIAGDSRS